MPNMMAPKVYFGLHMEEGVAEYRPKGQDPFRVLVPQAIANSLNPTFQGRPLFVLHDEQEDSERDASDVDGHVIRSFFNQADGKHWAEFIIVSEKGHEALAKGWKLSNCYIPQLAERKGMWHGVEFQKEVMGGTFDHMALVPNPRYENSVIYTPEEFKKYNEEKEAELLRLANSQDETKETDMSFSFFKKTKLENALDIEGTSVKLPKSGREVTLAQLATEADEAAVAAKSPRIANEADVVEVAGEKMTVKDVLAKLEALIAECAEAKADASVENEETEVADEASESEEVVENEDDDAKDKVEEKQKKDKMENSKEAADAAKAAKKANFEKLKNAEDRETQKTAVVDLSVDKVARGKSRYGSNN